MNSLSIQRALFLAILLSCFITIGCSSTPKEADVDQTKTDDKSQMDSKNRDVSGIDASDPSKKSMESKTGCVEGDCVNGIGKYVYENGDVYTGSFKNDQRDGKGTFEYSDGEKFMGNYLLDKRQGAGEYVFKNGDKYVGDFKDGQINGKGIYTFSDGKALNGEFQNDGMEGSGNLLEGETPRPCKVMARKLLCD